jgi:hypothetical protein
LYAAALAAGVLAAGSANAAIVTLTYTGTVADGGTDVSGAFGAMGADLSGDAFTAVFTFDTDEGTLVARNAPPVTSLTLAGGLIEGLPTFSSPGVASLTVNSVTETFGNDLGSDYFAQVVSGEFQFGADVFSSTTSPFGIVSVGSDGPGLSLNTPYSGPVCDQQCVVIGGVPTLNITHLDLTIEGSFANPTIPEPATWALMLLGFSLTGAALRRRAASAMA